MAVEDLTAPSFAPPEPRVTVLDALRRQLPLALLPVILLVGAALAIGMLRTPEYTSEARLNVGGLNLTSQSIEGYTAAVTQLSIAYARAIDATGVVTRVARERRLSPAEVTKRVSATEIEGATVIRVFATGQGAAETQRLADAAADSLVNYAIGLNSGRRISGPMLTRFSAASREFRRLSAQLAGAPPNSAKREALRTRVDVARLRMQTAGFLYQQSQAGQAATQLVQKLAPAQTAKDDRATVLRDLLAGAAIGGILIGIGLAVARANAVARRRLGHR